MADLMKPGAIPSLFGDGLIEGLAASRRVFDSGAILSLFGDGFIEGTHAPAIDASTGTIGFRRCSATASTTAVS